MGSCRDGGPECGPLTRLGMEANVKAGVERTNRHLLSKLGRVAAVDTTGAACLPKTLGVSLKI